MEPVRVAIAYHSGYGHTARQAAAVAAGAASVPGVQVEARSVATLDDGLWESLAAADAIIFGSPTYMGSQSAAFQAFAEASAKVWANLGWKDKLAAGCWAPSPSHRQTSARTWLPRRRICAPPATSAVASRK